jgi:hypothetical protein
MKKVIIGFSRPMKYRILSSLICFITNSNVSHTYVRIPVPEYGESMVFQASGLSVNYCNYKVFQEKAKVVEEYEIEVSDDVFAIGELMRVMEAGKPYSVKELVGLLWVLVMRGLGIRVGNPFKDGSASYICVELVMLCVGLRADSENTTQEDFRRWCKKHGKLISIEDTL